MTILLKMYFLGKISTIVPLISNKSLLMSLLLISNTIFTFISKTHKVSLNSFLLRISKLIRM